MSGHRVAAAVASRLEGIWVLGHAAPPNTCLVIRFLVPGSLRSQGKDLAGAHLSDLVALPLRDLIN